MPVISKKAAASSADVLDFARDACRLTGTDLSDVGTVLASVADDPRDATAATVAALEKLAAKKNGRPENVGGWLRTVAEKFLDGESVSLPAGARTFEQWQQQRARGNAIDKALGAITPTHTPPGHAMNGGGDWAGLADAFSARSRSEQDAAIDECVRGKWPLGTQLVANDWRGDGRRAWRETPLPAQVGKALAVLESIARKYLPHIETVAVKNPGRA